MHDKFVSYTREGQSPIDLTDCRFAPIPGTRIALVIPSHEAELRLSVQLGIAGRFKAVRGDALHNLAPGAEAFAQQNSHVASGLYLSISLLTTHQNWRGGWLLYFCASDWEEELVEYLAAAREAVVADLRKERAQRGSTS